MKLIDSVTRMSTLAGILRKEGKSIGLVPTMGYLHEGHASLIGAARKQHDSVILSVFVNPMQFGPKEDFDRYPRDLKRDARIAAEAGADILFHPSADEMYPQRYATYVNVERLADGLCGSSRPGHFRGVATVVAKLFGITRPHAAYFGRKDAQQVAVIRKMAGDLNMGVKIKVMPTVREKDGLAMSSRNAYMTERERADAAVIYRALRKAESLVMAGQRSSRRIIAAMAQMIAGVPSVKVEYISIVDPEEMSELETVSSDAIVSVAARVGRTRLIDNIEVKG